MTVGSQQYSITSTRSVIAQAPAGTAMGGPAGAVLVANTTGSAVTAYLGGDNVSSSNGYALAQNATVSITLYPGDVLYAITASSTATLSVLQT
jgi:hypothetical protein